MASFRPGNSDNTRELRKETTVEKSYSASKRPVIPVTKFGNVLTSTDKVSRVRNFSYISPLSPILGAKDSFRADQFDSKGHEFLSKQQRAGQQSDKGPSCLSSTEVHPEAAFHPKLSG